MATVPSFISYTTSRQSDAAVSLDAPFAAGFVTIFITRTAMERVATLDDDTIGWIQAKAWSSLIETDIDLVGEKIAFQCSRRDPDFLLGCANGHAFSRYLFDAVHVEELEALTGLCKSSFETEDDYYQLLCSGHDMRRNLLAEWHRQFEVYV
ncbi:MAG: hypothetical protein AAGE61_16155 [Pseudomonadota bacterium]